MAWSTELQEKTRTDIFPGAIVKNEHWKFGSYFPEADGTIILRGVKMKNYIPTSTDAIIATYKSKEAMLAAGWVMD